MNEAFHRLETAIATASMVVFSDFTRSFIVETNTASVVVGAVSSRKGKEGSIHPTHFASYIMAKAERKTVPVSEKSLQLPLLYKNLCLSTFQ